MKTLLKSMLALLLIGSLGLIAMAGVPVPKELPVEALFCKPAITSLRFSPNGKYVACLVSYKHRMNLAVIDLEKKTKNLLTNFEDKEISALLWANNDRILFMIDDAGDESPDLYAVNRDGSDPGILATGWRKSGSIHAINPYFRGLIRRSEKNPKQILVQAMLSGSTHPDVARLDLKTGNMTLVVPNPGKIGTWILDHDENPRVGVAEENQVVTVLYREANGGEWVMLSKHHMDEPGWEPLAFDGDNRTLYVASDVGRKTKAIYKYDTATRTMGELVYEDDTYDVDEVVYDSSKKKIVGISYDAEKPKYVWIDPETAATFKKIDASIPGYVNSPAHFAEDGSMYVIVSRNDRDPGVYYLFDKARGKIEELAVIYPALNPEDMAPMTPITYPARDGVVLHGYLTLPVGREPKGLPMIVHPHGGPFGPRDSWVYQQEVQLYANRGFAVLQVNYRGSGGYGEDFGRLGWKKWGREMQDDLTDGVRWAIEKGYADPARVAIVGASYGGYATMAGLVFTPELYCAGINYVGVTNLVSLMGETSGAAERIRYWRKTRIGDFNADRARLESQSPVNFADKIQVPLLMAYGKNDPRVNISQGYDMDSALKRAGKKPGVDYQFIIEGEEGHGFRKEEKSIAYFSMVDEFLKKNVLSIRPGSVKIGPAKTVELPAVVK